MIRSRRVSALALIALYLIAFLIRAYQPVERPRQWHRRSRAFVEAVAGQDWASTYQSRHPGFTVMAIGGGSLALFEATRGTAAGALFDWAARPDATRTGREISASILGLALVIAGLIVLNTRLLVRLGGWPLGLTAGGLMAFSPFYAAQGRVLHVDALAASLMLCSGLLILNHAHSRQRGDLLLSGLVGGLAILTKVPSLFLLPFAGLTLLAAASVRVRAEWTDRAQGRARWLAGVAARAIVLPLLQWIGMAALPLALWPAMWVQPGLVLQSIVSGAGEHVARGHGLARFFAGQYYAGQRPPILFYPATLLFNMTAVTLTLSAAAAGLYLFVPRRFKPPLPPLIFWLLAAYAFFFTVQMSIGAKQFDRYLLPTHVMLEVLAAAGAASLASLLQSRLPAGGRLARLTPAGMMAAALLLQAATALNYAPNFSAHHNALVGGNRVAVTVIELVGETEGANYVIDYLNQQPQPRRLTVGAGWPLNIYLGDFFAGEVVRDLRRDSEYYVFNLSAFQRELEQHEWRPRWDELSGQPPQLVVRIDGVDFFWVYAASPEDAHATRVIGPDGGWLIALAWLWAASLAAAAGWALHRPPEPAVSRRRARRLSGWEWAAVTALLVGAFALRSAHFSASPPGVSHDEVFDWYNAEMIYRGELRALYPYGGGREALYQILVAATFRLIGTNILGSRLPALALGMIGVAATFSLTRRLFGRPAALMAAAGITTSYWALTFSRLGERTGSAPVMALLAAYLFARLLDSRRPPPWLYAAAGAMLALALHTYPAALMLPLILLLWVAAAALLQRDRLAGKWPGLAASFLLAAILCIPLARSWADPQAAARAAAVDAPLEALRAGDPGPALANVLPVMGMFTVRGDPGIDVNNAALPVFPTLILAALFYIGLLIALGGLFQRGSPRREGYALALIWLAAMLVPTLVTQRALNPSRTIGLLGIAYIFPAIAVDSLMGALRQSGHLRLAISVGLVAALGLVHQLQNTALHYFTLWPADPAVRFWYQSDYVPLAADLDARPDRPPVAVGGVTPYLMDPGTLLLMMNDDVYARSLSFFDPHTALLVPAASFDGAAELAIPAFAGLHPALAAQMPGWGIMPEAAHSSYTRYRVSAGDLPSRDSGGQEYGFALPGQTSAAATLLGVEAFGVGGPGQSFTLLTTWIADGPTPVPLRIFLHLLDGNSAMLAQSDGLGAPSTGWRAGDFIAQTHDITLPADAPPGPYTLRIGIYDPQTSIRLTVVNPPGGDFVEIPFAP